MRATQGNARASLLRRRLFPESQVDLPAPFSKLTGLFFHPLPFSRAVCRTDLFGNLHRTELRSAHGTEVSRLCALVGQCFVVIFAGTLRVEAQVELILPTKLEACLG